VPTAIKGGTSKGLGVLNGIRDSCEVMSVFSCRFRILLAAFGLLLLSFMAVLGQSLPINPAGKLLPDKLGEFRADGNVEALSKELFRIGNVRPDVTSWASRGYLSKDGERFSVVLMTSVSDAAAYAHLTESRRAAESSGNEGGTHNSDIGTAGFSFWDGSFNDLTFFKGRVYAGVRGGARAGDLGTLLDFSKTLAETLDNGVGDIPVLVKHLPDWQNVRLPLYAVSVETLQDQFGYGSVFSAVSFDGGTEAVSADYGGSNLVLIEFNTPQVATDQNNKITAKILELRSQGQPVPTAYRRVGNYGVFVFDAPSAEAANQLIDQVKYQQVVQWLGENPFSYERATREFTETTLGVLVSVVQTSGLALVGCLAVGGLFGTLLFRSRRAQQRAREAYADSDAMLRLNIDELTPESDPARLLGRGN